MSVFFFLRWMSPTVGSSHDFWRCYSSSLDWICNKPFYPPKCPESGWLYYSFKDLGPISYPWIRVQQLNSSSMHLEYDRWQTASRARWSPFTEWGDVLGGARDHHIGRALKCQLMPFMRMLLGYIRYLISRERQNNVGVPYVRSQKSTKFLGSIFNNRSFLVWIKLLWDVKNCS